MFLVDDKLSIEMARLWRSYVHLPKHQYICFSISKVLFSGENPLINAFKLMANVLVFLFLCSLKNESMS